MHDSAINMHSFGPGTMTYFGYKHTVHIKPPVISHLRSLGCR